MSERASSPKREEKSTLKLADLWEDSVWEPHLHERPVGMVRNPNYIHPFGAIGDGRPSTKSKSEETKSGQNRTSSHNSSNPYHRQESDGVRPQSSRSIIFRDLVKPFTQTRQRGMSAHDQPFAPNVAPRDREQHPRRSSVMTGRQPTLTKEQREARAADFKAQVTAARLAMEELEKTASKNKK